MSSRTSIAFLVALALGWHLLAVLGPAWTGAKKAKNGRDFASYYYAVMAADAGEDPYNKKVLNRFAREDGRRGGVHPFFYPPPFVAGTAWVGAFDLHRAFKLWFWLDEAAALLAMLVLWRWWRPLHPTAPVAVAAVLALMTAVPNNHSMGQANFFVLALVILGLFAEHKKWLGLAGVLVGLACMAKMSPALFVAWWVLRRRWRPVVAACVTAVVVSLIALVWVGPEMQWRFYSEVLPKFASGDYNGLAIPIQLFGNHSLPNVYDRWFPSGANALSGTARVLSSVTTVGLLVGLGALFYARDDTPWRVAGQASAVGVCMLLIPVYTYEHHLIWAMPAAVLAGMAAVAGKLPLPLALGGGVSIALLCFDLKALKGFWMTLADVPMLGEAVMELKLMGLLGVLLTSVWIGRRG